uniref:Enamine deaminase RidA n=1 Tax=Thermosporothrix sp. COM3 TaxID=2490863 RepID=A0A455SDY1_9CHLR|nr:enamine deaminase RidA [Thermosporothrix sp. COM3]
MIEHLNPETLHRNMAFTQAVSVTGPVKMVYIGGQNAVDQQGNIVGKGDVRAQTQQVLENIEKVLTAAGARPEHIIKWTVLLVQGCPLQPGFEAFQRFWGNRPNPPIISMCYVAGLAHPDFLLEIDAVAAVPLLDESTK